MKKVLLITSLAFLVFGCDEFLDTENLTKKTTGNFPGTVEEAKQALAGVYASMPINKGSGVGDKVIESSWVTSLVISDDCLGGASTSGLQIQGMNKMMKSGNDMFATHWARMYRVIFRANVFIQSVENVKGWDSETQYGQFKGEGHFIRAWAYLDLCQMFGTVPLVTNPNPVNLPRASADELFAQIGFDLKTAIDIMPSEPFGSPRAPALGHATKWAAQALMARAFLFYTGYYQQESMPLPDGGKITKAQVADWLRDCVNNSRHALIRDFRELWPYCNEYTAPDYKYASENNLNWIGEDGANTETVFALKFGTKADFAESQSLSNQIQVYICPREPNNTRAFPLGKGWGNATVNPRLWHDWIEAEPNDIRRQGSICDVTSEIENMPNYAWGDENRQREETGLWQKKYVSITAKDANGRIEDYGVLMYGITSNYQLDVVQDLVLIRFADVLLMLSELTEDATYMNQVRARAGLSPLPYTVENLRNERRWELAFEGLRWFDLLRYGIDYAAEKVSREHGVMMKNQGEPIAMDMMNVGERIKETGGFWQIPEEQISLSDGVLTQNPGWDKESYIWNGY
jgi:starch-binding outer membrane protein, SusD/RagB family